MPDDSYTFIAAEKEKLAESLEKLGRILDYMLSALKGDNEKAVTTYCELHKTEFKKLEVLVKVYKKKLSDIHQSGTDVIKNHDLEILKRKYLLITEMMRQKKSEYNREISEIDLTSLRSNLFNVPESRYININS